MGGPRRQQPPRLGGSSTPLKVWNSNRMEERPSFVTDTSISITSSLPNHAEEVAFDVDAGRIVAVTGVIGNAERAQELDLRRLEVAEDGCKVNAAAGVGVDEANARLKAERLTLGHALTMPCPSNRSWRIAAETGARFCRPRTAIHPRMNKGT